MKKTKIEAVLGKALLLLLTFAFSLVNAQPPYPGDGGLGGVGPGEDGVETPINMYEGALLGVAVVMILAYYFYARNRRIANS